MNKIVNGVANDYEFPQLDWVHHDSTTIKIPSDEETTNLAKAIWNYFPLLVEENKTLKQELQRKDNIINELKEQLQQKEKSINKAIKLLNKYRNRKDAWGLWCMEYGDNAEIIEILGGKVNNE